MQEYFDNLVKNYPWATEEALDMLNSELTEGNMTMAKVAAIIGDGSKAIQVSKAKDKSKTAEQKAKENQDKIDGIIHCTGGGQTKILHFIDNLHIVKNNLFETPPIFKLIQNESGTDPKEMYKVFNMGHRMEIYTDSVNAAEIIKISKSVGIEAKIIGEVLKSEHKKLTIQSELGNFEY